MKKYLIIFLSLATSNLIALKEYIYPVGASITEHDACIYLIHQVGDQKLELYAWDPITKIARNALLSTYTPAGFTLLPHGKGFSINDNGRIRVKSPTKRSPKSIQFYPPVHDVSTINWNDDGESFYFMATKGTNFGIFESDLQGNVAEILLTADDDYMYPQRVGSALFMIKRTADKRYAIATVTYPKKAGHRESDISEYQEQLAQLLNGQEITVPSLIKSEEVIEILSVDQQPIVFLHMVNDHKGYYVAHPATIESNATVIPFTVYELACHDEGVWHEKALFNFSLPSYFFMASENMRLYESLLPLLPRYTQDAIYYVDCSDDVKTSIFKYECSSGMRNRLSHELTPSIIGESFFAPLVLNSVIFYGGAMTADDIRVETQQPTMWLNEDGVLCADVPFAVDLSQDCIDCLKQKLCS